MPDEKHLTYDQQMNVEPDALYVRPDRTRAQELHIESHAPYLKVWAGLAVFTAIEYFYAHFFKDTFVVLVLGLMVWAIIKASMVGWYFMHLKFEGKWVYGMLIPAGILAFILTIALVPDLAMQPVTEESPEEEESGAVSLLEPGVAPPPIALRA
jgi:cytochrome c oxidase subunit 4